MNKETVQTFEVLSVPSDHLEDQYLIVYTKHEGEYFDPEKIFGVYGADQVAYIVGHFRKTGVLLRPVMFPYGSWAADQYPYEAIDDDVQGLYVMQTTDVLYKLPNRDPE